jgi:hypothetical protein
LLGAYVTQQSLRSDGLELARSMTFTAPMTIFDFGRRRAFGGPSVLQPEPARHIISATAARCAPLLANPGSAA